MVKKLPVLALLAALCASGCGYTMKGNLPDDLKSVAVMPVKNGIDLSQEISQQNRYQTYRPGIEVDLTNAIIDRFVFDGTLKVERPENANILIEAKLIDYRRDPLRYSLGNDVEEYRISVVAYVSAVTMPGKKELWHDEAVTGDTTYYLVGSRASSENDAVKRAVTDLARRVVERTLDRW